jgi:hypothetical protein
MLTVCGKSQNKNGKYGLDRSQRKVISESHCVQGCSSFVEDECRCAKSAERLEMWSGHVVNICVFGCEFAAKHGRCTSWYALCANHLCLDSGLG